MTQTHRTTVFALGTATALSLTSCTASSTAIQIVAPQSAAAQFLKVQTAVTQPVSVPFSSAPMPKTLIARATGNLLTTEQKAQLTQLPIPIVAPTDLPAGFRLVKASGEKGQYANGDDDSGYAIVYQGNGNTCITIASSKDGPRSKGQNVVQTRFGSVAIYTENLRGKPFIYSFIPIAGNPSFTSGGSMPAGKGATQRWKPCNAVSMATYTQVLRSLEVVK